MANPHSYGSFSYKVIDPVIKGILENRERLNNTLQIGTPFVKATATIELDEILGGGNIGFTLGIHNNPNDLTHQEIYGSVAGAYPVVGYTYTPSNGNQLVYAKPPEGITGIVSLFDQGTTRYTFPDQQLYKAPPPGITRFSIGRNKNGLLAIGEFSFSVPSLLQLEVLHRVFLVPGVGMVLEWGQQFANDNKQDFGENGLNSITVATKTFPWYDSAKRKDLLTRLGKREVGIQEIIDQYVIPTQGQYMWMFGRVANFTTKANSDGSFECSVKVVGPSEDSWAYSTKSTVIPPKDPSGQICLDSVHSVESYFKVSSQGLNLKTLLDKVLVPGHPWNGHVVRIENGNHPEGEPTEGTKTPAISEFGFGDDANAYFMTWRFFVNVVLNDENEGVKAIFKKAGLLPEELKRISILRPYSAPNLNGAGPIDDPFENFVGSNKYLRSVDPSTLIIVNEAAAAAADQERQNANIEIDSKYTSVDPDGYTEMFSKMGDYNKLPAGLEKLYLQNGLLSTGVWLNHKAVVTCMLGGDTLIKGISNLLDRMNAASNKYWGLTIDEVEPSGQGDTHNYTVIDTKLRESSEKAVEVAFEKLHVFNKYIRKSGNQLVGSELIDCQIDLSLPKRMFAQIGTLGLVKPEDVQSLNGQGEQSSNESTPIISDPNETIRKMFAITTISPKQGGRNPDVTLQYAKEGQSQQRSVCGNNIDSQAPLLSAGSGVGNTTISKDAAAKVTKNEASSSLESAKQSFANKCGGCPPLNTQIPTSAPSSTGGGTVPTTGPSSPNQYTTAGPPPDEPPAIRSLDPLAPKFREKIQQLLAAVPDAMVLETYRSPQRSDFLFGIGRYYVLKDGRGTDPKAGGKGPQFVSNARGGSSWHNYAVAVDIYQGIVNKKGKTVPNFNPSAAWLEKLGSTAERLGLEWGGRWKNPYDPPHVQWKNLPKSPTSADRSMLAANNLKGVWQKYGAG